MKTLDERNVTISEAMGDLSFLRGTWPAGPSFKAESKVLCIPVGARASLACPAWSSTVPKK